MSLVAAELEVSEPEVEVSLEPDGCHPVDVEDAEDPRDVGDGLLPLLAPFPFPLLACPLVVTATVVVIGFGVGGAYDCALAEVAEGVEAELVGDVVEEVLSERGVASDAELEVAAAAAEGGC